MNAVGTSVVIVNSYEAAAELLDKRSNIYSSRSVLVTCSFRLHTLLLQSSVANGKRTDGLGF